MNFLEYSSLFASVLVGGSVAFYLRRNNKEFMQLMLSFSGAYILGITFLHLVPETYEAGGFKTGLYILLGFFIQLILEQLSRGVEHGHIHALKSTTAAAAFSMMLGLCLHAFIEGMPLSGYADLHTHGHGHEHAHGHTHEVNHLLYGIVIHKVHEAFALGLLLLISGFRERTVVIYLLIFASMSPLGAFLTEFLVAQNLVKPTIMVALMGIAIGSFLHIATTILFETDTNHKISIRKFAAIAVGLAIALATLP